MRVGDGRRSAPLLKGPGSATRRAERPRHPFHRALEHARGSPAGSGPAVRSTGDRLLHAGRYRVHESSAYVYTVHVSVHTFAVTCLYMSRGHGRRARCDVSGTASGSARVVGVLQLKNLNLTFEFDRAHARVAGPLTLVVCRQLINRRRSRNLALADILLQCGRDVPSPRSFLRRWGCSAGDAPLHRRAQLADAATTS